ncbi:hypothetical protein [Rhizobium leguminosarum]|uniref:hypothetical protein n=1 Tax=Rhizobium TaxID=379 RepID=UPI001F2286D7|nr:hypothetical protein [Rhizobium leguminosarum]UIK20897.1 hypothetical protein LZK79_31485 [Rhizobium leguminosarum]
MAGTDKKNTDESSVGDWPVLTENHWYSLAITSAIFTAIAVVTAFILIFGNGFDGEADLKMAQGLAPFGVALFAVVTFCTVGWRGSISTRQANQSESEGRAKLLQEGAKLLGEPGKDAHVSAGIATLGVLVSGTDNGYARQAMDLLADFVEDHMSKNHANRHRPQISGVMRTGDRNGANTEREIVFDYTDPDRDDGDDEPTYWYYIPGFKLIRYQSGVFEKDVHYNLNDLKNVKFRNTELVDWGAIDIDDRFYRCRFRRCDIASIETIVSLLGASNHKFAFESCDFSGCKILDHGLLQADLKAQGNYFVDGSPPILVGLQRSADWDALLERKDKKPDWWAF